jgi:hypothetical protein
MGKVTAKVKLSSKGDGPGAVPLVFYADYAEGRNKEWAAATPTLSLNMTVKPEVAELFEVGKPYTLTFEASED